MNATMSLIVPRNEYQVFMADTRGVFLHHQSTHNALRAYGIYKDFQSKQTELPGDSLVALIEDNNFKMAVHGELRQNNVGLLKHHYDKYSRLTFQLREKTRQIWERVELQGVR